MAHGPRSREEMNPVPSSTSTEAMRGPPNTSRDRGQQPAQSPLGAREVVGRAPTREGERSTLKEEHASRVSSDTAPQDAETESTLEGHDLPTDVARSNYPTSSPFVSDLVRELRGLLRKKGEPTAMKRLHAFLDKMPDDNPTRFQAFEATMRMFLREGCPMAAVTCYTRMTEEGFLCSISLRAQMMVVSLVNRLPAPTEFFALLETWFQNKRFDESALQDMLFLLDDVISKDPVFVDTVAKLYLRCKPPGYSFSRGTVSWLVYVHARAGSKDSAKEWIDPERHAGASSPNPYTSLLRFVDGSSGDDELYLWIIQRMREFQIQPDLPFYNALLFAEFARRRYEHAFKIYALLKSSDDPAVTPDGLTFTTLFRVQLDMSRPDTQRMRSMPGAPSPRQLYREMIACHVSRTDNGLEGTLTDSTLVLALRVFMKRRDYAAAFVALKTIQHCKMPIDLVMYHRILAFLMQRIEQQLSSVAVRRGPRSSWSYRFLGLATAPTKQRPVYDPRVLDAVLRIGMIRRLSLDYVAPQLELTDDDPPEERPDFDAPAGSSTHKQSAPTRSPKLPESSFDFETYTKAFRIHGMPTTLDVTGTVKSNPRRIYSATPLERILRRAMLADRPASIVAAMKDVNTELAMAKEQMLGDLKNKLSRSSAGKQKRRDVDRNGSKKQADGAASGRAGDNAIEADG